MLTIAIVHDYNVTLKILQLASKVLDIPLIIDDKDLVAKWLENLSLQIMTGTTR